MRQRHHSGVLCENLATVSWINHRRIAFPRRNINSVVRHHRRGVNVPEPCAFSGNDNIAGFCVHTDQYASAIEHEVKFAIGYHRCWHVAGSLIVSPQQIRFLSQVACRAFKSEPNKGTAYLFLSRTFFCLSSLTRHRVLFLCLQTALKSLTLDRIHIGHAKEY